MQYCGADIGRAMVIYMPLCDRSWTPECNMCLWTWRSQPCRKRDDLQEMFFLIPDATQEQRQGRVLRGGLWSYHFRNPIPGLLFHRPQILPHLYQQAQEPPQVGLVKCVRFSWTIKSLVGPQSNWLLFNISCRCIENKCSQSLNHFGLLTFLSVETPFFFPSFF